jgi:hypothetical protein
MAPSFYVANRNGRKRCGSTITEETLIHLLLHELNTKYELMGDELIMLITLTIYNCTRDSVILMNAILVWVTRKI